MFFCLIFPYPDLQVDHLNLLKQFEHLDPQNQHTFEARDLELLIQTVRDARWGGEGLGRAVGLGRRSTRYRMLSGAMGRRGELG